MLLDVPVGDLAIAKEHRENVTVHRCLEGIGQIEAGLANHSGEEPLAAEHPNLVHLIESGSFGAGWQCTHATAKFSPQRLRTVVTRARQTALQLCLECEEKGVVLLFGEDDSTTPQERKRWMDMLKEEGTKAAMREACGAAFNYFFMG